MLKTIAAAALMTTSLAVTGAFAQQPSPNTSTTAPNSNMTSPNPAPAATPAPMNNPALNTSAAMMPRSGWRASKLIGLNIYNQQNEKLGDVNEIILDHQGKITGVVIGVGGFLGMGEHDVMVAFDQLRFVDEARTAANTSNNAAANNNAARNTTVGAANPRTDAGNAGNANVTANSATRSTASTNADRNWYPDHGILNASKDQLKAMPEFTYSSYNNPAGTNNR